MPLSTRIYIPFPAHQEQQTIPQQEMLDTSRSEASDNLVANYNELRDTLNLMHADRELKTTLVKSFCKFEDNKIKGNEAA